MHIRCLIPAAIALAAGAGPAAAQDDMDRLAAGLQSYRAVYDLRQVATAAGGPTVRISGRMTSEAQLGCKDSVTTTSLILRVSGPRGAVELSLEAKAQESRDGRTLRNSMLISENGRLIRRHEAEATLQTRDGPGQGVVKRGAPESLKLVRGTVLPGTHYMRAMAAAAAGKAEVKHRVYVGEDELRLAEITTAVTGSGTTAASAALGEFGGKPGWKFRETVRGVGSQANSEPRVTETFVTNEGVMAWISFTVQGVQLAGIPVKIEKLPKPACP